MTSPRTPERTCDCDCSAHHGSPRPAYDSAGCTCLMTCSTQPVTLVVADWACALFLHPGSDRLWFVPSAPHGRWDWEYANEIDERGDMFVPGRRIETLLHRIGSVIADPGAP